MVCRVAAAQAIPVREADTKCALCHSQIFQNYLATPMANASGLATEQLRPATFMHTASSIEYKITIRDHVGVLSYRATSVPGVARELPLNYFLGSGHLGTTYLYSVGDYLFESPVAWYAASQHYDMKPGLAELGHMPPPLPMQSGCVRCHMSAVQPNDSGTLNRYSDVPFKQTGITCEACHGDSGRHGITNGKEPIVNPARLKADLRDSICVSCHLEGDVSVERAGLSILNFRPGESISTYMTYYVRAGANPTDRGVSEVEQLSQSTCKRASGDRMSCTSCHNPHFTPDASHQAAFFRGKCLACHSQPGFAKAHHPENEDCTSCHMPRTSAVNILHVAWTDHRILRLPEAIKANPQAKERGELTPIFSPSATKRDQAMANYQALLDGDRSLESTAWGQLNAQRELIVNDKEALDALGTLSAERGDFPAAEQAFRRVLELDSVDLTALSNLGTLLAKQGKLKESLSLLLVAFGRNQDIPALAKNLARVQCMAGDGSGARTTLNTALIYCPDLEDVRRLLTQIGNCGGGDGK